MFQNFSISKKITLILLSVSLISIISAVVYASYQLSFVETQEKKDLDVENKLLLNEKLSKKMDVGLTNAVALSMNHVIQEALKEGVHKKAYEYLAQVNGTYQNNTNFKGVKVVLIDKNLQVVARSWNKSHGEKVSDRHAIKDVLESKKAQVTFEATKIGIMIKAIVPVIVDKEFIGIIEFLQGTGSVSRDFKKENTEYIMLINPEIVSKFTSLAKNKKVGEYVVGNNKWFKDDTVEYARSIDFKTLFKEGYLLDENFFTSYLPVKDVDGKVIGIHLIGEKRSLLEERIASAESITFSFSLFFILVLIIVMAIVILSVKIFILTPLKEVNAMTKQLASSEGDLTKRLHVLAHDELGATSQNVNRFIENLQLVLSDIITSVKKNIELAHRISKESSSITDSAKEQISDATHLVNSLESVYHDVDSANTIMLEIQEQSAYNLEAFSKMHHMVTDIIDQFKKNRRV